MEHNTVLINTLLYIENHTFILSCDMFIHIYRVRSEIDQLSTNSFLIEPAFTLLCSNVNIISMEGL